MGKSRGSATFLVMLLVMVILTVSISFNWLIKEYVKNATAFTEKAQAALRARSIFDLTVYLILNGKKTNKAIYVPEMKGLDYRGEIPLDGTPYRLSEDTTLKIQDSNGLISLTTINSEALRNLLIMSGASPEDLNSLIDCLLDWVDPDDLKRLNGAERFDYSALGYEPRNMRIQYLEELKLVKGFSDFYQKLAPYLTILPQTGFNPNTAPKEVLKAYLGINDETAKVLMDRISISPVRSDSELYLLTGKKIVKEEGVYFYPSSFLDIRIEVGEKKPIFSLKAGIDTRPNLYFPFSVIYWKEE